MIPRQLHGQPDGQPDGKLARVLWRWCAALTGVVACAGCAVASKPTPPARAAERALAFAHVSVVDVTDGRVVPEQTVVITGARISALGPTGRVAVPARARVVNARGQYLIPGLWDMHTHLGVNAPKAEQRVVARTAYLLLLANGVTGIRDAGSPIPLDSLVAWRRAILAGERIGPPRQLLAGPFLEGTFTWTHSVVVRTLADGRRIVDSLLAAGADHIKLHDFAFSEPLRDSLVAELRARHILFGGHMSSADTGARFADHTFFQQTDTNRSPLTDGFEINCVSATATLAHCRRLAERLRRNDMWLAIGPFVSPGAALALERAWHRLTPTQQRRVRPDGGGFAAQSEIEWAAARDSFSKTPATNYNILEQSGFPLLLGADVMHGSDWVFGACILDAVTGLVQQGMSPLAALQVVTLNPAKALHATDSLGTVAVGKLADLVVLDGDPLADIRNVTKIRAVLANGRYFDRAMLDSLLASVDYDLVSHVSHTPSEHTESAP